MTEPGFTIGFFGGAARFFGLMCILLVLVELVRAIF